MAQTSTSLTSIDPADAAIAAEAATLGDLANLTPSQRTQLYGATCRSMGLNPLSQPFQYIKLNGRLTLYATRTATDQLRKINHVSITGIEKEVFDGVLMVTVHARDQDGREDTEVGAVMIAGLKGEALANAHMKAITKAKRRVTLSISGLGWLDETEVETIPSAQAAIVDRETGELHDAPSPIRAINVGNAAPPASLLNALFMWAEEIGLGTGDLNNAATYLNKGTPVDVRKWTDEGLRRFIDKMKDAHDRNPEKFHAWIRDLRQEVVPVEVDTKAINTSPASMEEIDAALANATPTSLPIDISDAPDAARFLG